MVQIDSNGAYSRAPIFTKENYDYRKDCICVHLMSVDIKYQLAIKGGPFVPQKVVDGVSVVKPPKDWNEAETKMASYDLKARNILITSLSMNVYFTISHCKMAQAMCNYL